MTSVMKIDNFRSKHFSINSSLQAGLNQIQISVNDLVSMRLKADISLQNKATKIINPSFEIFYLFLVRRVDFGHKIMLK